MKQSIVVFFTRAVSSKFTKSLIEQATILKEYQKDYHFYFVTNKKTDIIVTDICDVAGLDKSNITCIFTDEKYEASVRPKKYSSWLEFIHSETWFDELDNVKHIIIFGGLLSSACGINREMMKLDYYLGNQQQMNFVTNGSLMCIMFQLIKFSNEKNIPLHEICYDPTENSLDLLHVYVCKNLICYHGYDVPRWKMNRLDSLQYYLASTFDLEDSSEKDLDVVFGYTATTKDREKQYDIISQYIDSLSDLKVQTFRKHNRLGIDTFIDRDSYLSYIKRARFTFIIPPYDLSHFSVYRFIESIHNNCLPLIACDVKTNEFIQSFALDNDKVSRLIFNYNDEFPEIDESERLELIEYFRDKILKYERTLKI